MKLQHCILLCLLLSLTSCWTLIATAVATSKPVETTQVVYTTHVTTPAPKNVTTTTLAVTSYNTDWSFYLDLHAVAAAFAEARSVQEFENMLNSSRYMINNLDLNGDGYIDYLRVLETRQGYYPAYLIQACVAPSLVQDVATLVVERRASALYVEVVGDPYLYGYNYIVRPVFVNRPPLWDVLGKPSYTPWCSPYHYGSFPSHYQCTKPVYLTHYQAYVNTYLKNHHYCHVCDYPPHVFYKDYHVLVNPHSRNDYRNQHPDKSFERRVNPNATSRNIRNAGDLRSDTQSRQVTSESKNTTTTTTTTTTTPSRTGQTTTPSRTNQTTTSTQTTQTSTPTRTGQTTTPSRTTQTTTSTKTNQTTTSSRVNQTTTTTTTTTKTGSNTSRTSSTTVKEGTPTRVSTTVKTTSPTTTVQTKVNKSGTTRTTVKTTNTSKSTSVSAPTTSRTTRATTTERPATSTTNTQSSRTSRTTSGGTR